MSDASKRASDSLVPFDFNGDRVRVITRDGEPWFVAADVAIALGYVNPSKAIGDHVDDDDRSTLTVREGGPERIIINESGLYALIFGSKLPAAKAFKRWVTAEVLPELRRTGKYGMTEVAPKDDLDVIQGMIDSLRAERARVSAVEAKISAIEGGFEEFTTLAYAKLNDLPTDQVSCQRHGQRASKLLRSRGAEPRKVKSAIFGTVNVYPVSVLDETAEG